MAGISKRIFGSEIPTPVKKKLEAYQKLQRGPKDELDSIGLNPGEEATVDSDFRYKDLINSNLEYIKTNKVSKEIEDNISYFKNKINSL